MFQSQPLCYASCLLNMLCDMYAADEVKYLLIGNGLLEEGVGAHIASSITAGLAVATTTNPLDLVKSRYMNQEFDKVGLGVASWLA